MNSSDALCPLYPDKRPSLHAKYVTGAFRYFVCDARGSDVLAFPRLRTGIGFIEPAKALKAWEARLR